MLCEVIQIWKSWELLYILSELYYWSFFIAPSVTHDKRIRNSWLNQEHKHHIHGTDVHLYKNKVMLEEVNFSAILYLANVFQVFFLKWPQIYYVKFP